MIIISCLSIFETHFPIQKEDTLDCLTWAWLSRLTQGPRVLYALIFDSINQLYTALSMFIVYLLLLLYVKQSQLLVSFQV